MSSMRLSSWVIIATPAPSASPGPAKRMGFPSISISPPSGSSSPMMMLRKVDLPAPLPPHKAWTVPGRRASAPERSAGTPWNDLRIFSARKRRSAMTWPAKGCRGSTRGEQEYKRVIGEYQSPPLRDLPDNFDNLATRENWARQTPARANCDKFRALTS